MTASAAIAPDAVNEVRLRGRWTGATARELPSGDEVVVARVIVARAEGDGVDTIDCALWARGLRRRAMQVPDGQLVEVLGQLRRRFWRTAGGAASRYEVEVHTLRRVSAAAGRPGVP